jgi:hypothetical protein
MFSLQDIQRSRYVVFDIKPVIETTNKIPIINSNSEVRQNIDISQVVFNKDILLQSLTADSLLESDQNLSLGEVYSVGYGLNFAQNRAVIPKVQDINDNGGIVTRGYVGNNAIPLPGTTGTLILP